jgi:hypothetical protein
MFHFPSHEEITLPPFSGLTLPLQALLGSAQAEPTISRNACGDSPPARRRARHFCARLNIFRRRGSRNSKVQGTPCSAREPPHPNGCRHYCGRIKPSKPCCCYLLAQVVQSQAAGFSQASRQG